MNIKVFQITAASNIFLTMKAETLDEMTRNLPRGFYTTFSTLSDGTRVLGLRKHMQRLYAPAGNFNLFSMVNEQIMRERISLLVKENLPHESRIRLILTKNTGEMYIGIQSFMPLPASIYANGVHVITSSITRHNPLIKDTGFISASAEQRKLLSEDVFEILLKKHGSILEGMTSNFYAVNGSVLTTSRRGILLGVTRKAILRLARGQGMSIEYRAPVMPMCKKMEEAFLTSSSRGVVPIISIDEVSIGRGKVGKWTKALSLAYQIYVNKNSEKIIA